MSLPTRIYLTGFMGSGKSTLGPPLARIVHYRFYDLDSIIEDTIHCTIAEYFESHGEPAFRKTEREQFLQLIEKKRLVVALGGGALTQPEILEGARASGLIVYLRWPVERLMERLQRSGTRPLLRDVDGRLLPEDQLRERITSMLEKREPIYCQADVVVDLNRHRVPRAVDEIVTAVRQAAYRNTGRKDRR